MEKSSSQKTSSPKITPKEEHVTLEKPASLNPFLPVSQVDFTFNEITFTTNNEVALLYPSHPNQYYFEAVSDFISKCYLKEAFTRAPNQYKECLTKIWYTTMTLDDSKIWISYPIREVRGDIGITTFRNTLRAQYLPHVDSSAKDKIPSHPLPPTLVVGEMHKEAQQAAGGPKYLGATSKEEAHPQLSSDSTSEANLGISAPKDSIS
nr:hypothetical protein [Tanacetum cinerariifolium]